MSRMLQFTVLASGSSGNCAYLETDKVRVLIDAGLSAKKIEQCLAALGKHARELQAIFITHEHTDHIQGLSVLSRRYNIPVYCNRQTAERLRGNMKDFVAWRFFETGKIFTLEDLEVDTFSVPHDAYEPVGYVFRHRLGNIGFLTDLGHATQLVLERVRRVRTLVLEANHDVRMLQNDAKRPWPVKQRILSRHGHLSNEAAAQVALEVLGKELEDIYLGHLSSDCNTPEIAEKTIRSALTKAGAGHVRVHRTFPDQMATTLRW